MFACGRLSICQMLIFFKYFIEQFKSTAVVFTLCHACMSYANTVSQLGSHGHIEQAL